MDREKVFEQVKAIIVDRLGVDAGKVTMDARFREDLEADSLDLVELLMDFDEKFGAKIEDEEAEQIKTVGQAVGFVMEKLSAAK
jgi:acyl carrier protein